MTKCFETLKTNGSLLKLSPGEQKSAEIILKSMYTLSKCGLPP